MLPLMAAVAIQAGASALGNYLGGREQARAINKSNAILGNMFQQQQAYSQPYRDVGLNMLPMLQREALAPAGMSEAELFQLQEGRKALRSAQAARGIYRSQAALNAETNLSRNAALDAYQRQLNLRLVLTELGANPTAQLSQAAGQRGQAASQNALALGDVRANQYKELAGTVNQGINNYLFASLAYNKPALG